MAKPDPQVFGSVAARHGASPSGLVHVGDSWAEDVMGVLSAGGRAVWISAGRPVPDAGPVRAGRVLVAEDITATAGLLANLS
jgi:FMN hydrolase / 5-amino-6-(5-phospho-D-ribitylamino)uracil phosphatase